MLPPPDDNPKTAEGLKKPQLQLVPPSAVQAEAVAFLDGAEKYGPYNWRQKPVSISTYVAAARRHLDALWDGEDLVQDSKNGATHMAAVRACMAILIDAKAAGMLIDDRPPALPRPVHWIMPNQDLVVFPPDPELAHEPTHAPTQEPEQCPHRLNKHSCRECAE